MQYCEALKMDTNSKKLELDNGETMDVRSQGYVPGMQFLGSAKNSASGIELENGLKNKSRTSRLPTRLAVAVGLSRVSDMKMLHLIIFVDRINCKVIYWVKN